ncbi:MAG: 2'-5' RNA ligase family protein [Erythrobacter sp.]|jgi:hypothetical protein
MSAGTVPLILTAQLPPDLQARFSALRSAHYPPERNHLEAHVTLFHALPAMGEEEVVGWCRRLAGEFAPVAARVVGVMRWEQGTAIRLESPAMLRLRDRLASSLHGLLTAQDQHRPRLHVTIQNKVPAAEARVLQARLADAIAPQPFAFRGLALHRYRGGPWEPLKQFTFHGGAKA